MKQSFSDLLSPARRLSKARPLLQYLMIAASALALGGGSQANTVTYTMQTGNLNGEAKRVPGGGAAGSFNSTSSVLGLYANGGSGGTNESAFETFSTSGLTTGAARPLQVGDSFSLTLSVAANPYGFLGVYFDNNTNYTTYTNYNSNEYASVTLGSSGNFMVNNSGTAINTGIGAGTTLTLNITITSSDTFNMGINGTTYYDLGMENSPGSTSQIQSLALELQNDDGNFYVSNGSLTNTGTVTLGGANIANLTNSGTITDGLAANSTSTASVNNLVKTGTGTVSLTASNTYSGTTTISAGTLQLGNGGTTGSISPSSAITDNATLAFNRTNTVTQGTDFSSGAITGSGGLTQSGSGTLVLNAANTYQGTTTISAGKISLGIANGLPTVTSLVFQGGATNPSTLDLNGHNQTVASLNDGGSSSGAILNSSGTPATFTLNNTDSNYYYGTISNSINLVKSSSGTEEIGGANTFGGTATINQGTIVIGVSNAGTTSGALGSSTNTVLLGAGSGATAANLYIGRAGGSGPGSTGGLTFSNNISLQDTDSGTLTLGGQNTSGTNIFSGNVTLGVTPNTGKSLTVGSVSGGTVEFTGNILANGSDTTAGVSISSGGIVEFAGANTYAGQTAINGATLQINASNNLGNGSATNTISFNGGTLESTGNSYDLTANRAITLNGSGTVQSDAGTLTISGNITNGANALTVTGAGNTTISGVLGSGSGALIMSGLGALTLSNVNTYTGETDINSGNLEIGASGGISSSSAIYLGNGNSSFQNATATLTLLGNQTLANTFTVNASSNTAANPTGHVIAGSAGGTESFTGTITVNDDADLYAPTSGTLNFNDQLYNSSTIRTVYATGGGVVVLGGTTDNTNIALVVSNGTAILGKASSSGVHALGNSSGTALTVNSGGTAQLGGSGGNQIYGSSGVVVNSGGVFDLNGESQTLDTISLNGSGIGGNGALINSGTATATLTLTGASSLAGATSVGGNAGNITFAGNGAISMGSAETLTKIGTDTLTLSNGSTTDNLNLLLTASGGTVVLNKATSSTEHAIGGAAIGSGATVQLAGSGGYEIWEGSTPVVNSGGVLDLNGQNQTFTSAGPTINGSGISSGGALINSNTGQASTLTSGVVLGSASSIGGAGSLTVAGTISDSGSGYGVTKVGAGALTLSNTSTYSGATTVSAGSEIVAAGGSLAGTGSASVSAGADLEVDGALNALATTSVNGTLQGTGSVGAITANGGTIDPGLTVGNSLSTSGTLAAGGAVTLSGSTNFSIRIGTAVGAAGTDSDQLAVTSGNISLNDANLQLVIGSNLSNADANDVYVIVNGGAGLTGTGGNVFQQGSAISMNGYNFSIDYASNATATGTGSDVVLKLNAVPEPGTWTGLVFGAAFLAMRRRRRS